MKRDMVSVIITTYNRKIEILKRALESVLNQTYKNIEIILINACPENIELSKEIKEHIQKLSKYNLINYICLEKIRMHALLEIKEYKMQEENI